MRPCVLEYAEEIKRSLERMGGWTRDKVWCRLHLVYHELTPDLGQRPLLPVGDMEMRRHRQSTPKFRLLSEGLPCFHESTSEILKASCVYCGSTLHVHKDELGRVRSGRHGAGYLEQKCPACHKTNAVFPIYGGQAIRTARLVDGMPAMQMKLN